MFSPKKSAASPMNIDTLIGEHCTIQGNVGSQNSIKIDGGIIGHVASEGMVIIGENGWVKGNLRAKELLVYGRVEGDIETHSLDLKASAHIHGNIDTHTLQVDPGAVYQGSVTMHSQSANALPDNEAQALPGTE